MQSMTSPAHLQVPEDALRLHVMHLSIGPDRNSGSIVISVALLHTTTRHRSAAAASSMCTRRHSRSRRPDFSALKWCRGPSCSWACMQARLEFLAAVRVLRSSGRDKGTFQHCMAPAASQASHKQLFHYRDGAMLTWTTEWQS